VFLYSARGQYTPNSERSQNAPVASPKPGRSSLTFRSNKSLAMDLPQSKPLARSLSQVSQ